MGDDMQRVNVRSRQESAIAPAQAPWRVEQHRLGPNEWVLESELRVPRTVAEVFPFFSKAENLNELTPPWVRFKITSPLPIHMGPGTVIDYRIRVRGITLNWRTLITRYEPEKCFVDEQVRGPYGLWHHSHFFESSPDGAGTICRDRVRYGLRPALVGRSAVGGLVQRWMVGPDCQKIFEYRAKRMLELFAAR